MNRYSRFDHEKAEALGHAIRAIRLIGPPSESRAALGARCHPPITEARLSVLEHGRGKIRPSELAALKAALPKLASLFVARPLVPGVPARLPRPEPAR